MIITTDIFATVASIVGYKLKDEDARDSYDMLPAMIGTQGKNKSIRPYLLTQNFRGEFQIRQGNWKFLNHKGSGGNNYEEDFMKKDAIPETEADAPAQLYNLANDPGLPDDLQFGLRRTSPVAEPVDLTANWEIRFDTLWGGPGTFSMDKLTSWTEVEEEGVRFYSGTATYSRGFTVTEDALAKGTEAYVVFEDIQEMARVSINGSDCGIVWLPPYKANITRWLKPGENTISVQVVNTWNKRIVGDLIQPDGTQYTSTNVKTRRFRATSPLLKSGLMGKAEIVYTKKKKTR